MDLVPLWAEFTLFMALILILLTFAMSFLVYSREQSRTVEARVMAAESLLNLKAANLEEYMASLSEFAIQPVYDSDCYAAMLSGRELSDRATESLRSTVRTWFYTRSDLLSYHIYLLNQNLAIGRDYGKEGVRVYRAEDMEQSSLYKACTDSRKNYAVLPSEHGDALFHFAHSIIRIQDRSVVGLVDFEVDRSGIEYLSTQPISPGEALNLYNSDGALLYTDAKGPLFERIEAYTPEENRAFFLSEAERRADIALPEQGRTEADIIHKEGGEMGLGKTFSNGKDTEYLEIEGVKYLSVRTADSDKALYLSTMIPLSDILGQLRQTRRFSILIGLAFILAAVIGANLLIRYLSAPLTALVNLQESFGEGQISDTHFGRSREGAELSRSYNEMTRRIDRLLKENYAAALNEKNARLAALEAEINPHFLYNTLQAIGSEALLNDQTEIYRMLTSLASNLRYSIKAPNVVSLRDELKYTDDYVFLQKIRMGERLSVERETDEEALFARLPKLCIQPLVENSILHGIGGERDSISIVLSVQMDGGRILIRVRDDGIGIEEEELREIRNSFRSQTLNDANQSIGLANLYNRLTLLYGQEADMTIESRTGEGSYTEVKLVLQGQEGHGPADSTASLGEHRQDGRDERMACPANET